MARYIEVDELKAKINANAWSNPVVPIYVNKVVDRTPTADVAPRSEVEALEKEIDRLKKILDYYALQYGTVKSQQQVIDRAKSEVAREVLAKVDDLAWRHKMRGHVSMDKFHDDIEELKQKYTEDQT